MPLIELSDDDIAILYESLRSASQAVSDRSSACVKLPAHRLGLSNTAFLKRAATLRKRFKQVS